MGKMGKKKRTLIETRECRYCKREFPVAAGSDRLACAACIEKKERR